MDTKRRCTKIETRRVEVEIIHQHPSSFPKTTDRSKVKGSKYLSVSIFMNDELEMEGRASAKTYFVLNHRLLVRRSLRTEHAHAWREACDRKDGDLAYSKGL